MEKIKVLQVNKLYYPEVGGIEKTLQQISEGLVHEAEVELKVLVCQKKGKYVEDHINGVEIHRAGSLGVIASVPISISFLWTFRRMALNMDIVHLHLPFPLGDLACLLSGYKGKVVACWHSDVVKQKKWMIIYRPIMEHFLKRADLILVGAQGVAKGSRYLGPYLDKCKVVPFAIENSVLENSRKGLEERWQRKAKDKFKILFVGRLVYYKGCSILIEAFAKMKEEAILTILGDGPLKEELEERCKKLGIAEKVVFAGFVSETEKRRYFEQADVFVLPSVERSEAFALVQLEAMAYGIPVINTNLPSGVPEVSVHGKTGLTVKPGDIDGLASAMEWMLENRESRIRMGKEARKRVEQEYTEEKMIGDLKKIYLELYGKKCNIRRKN